MINSIQILRALAAFGVFFAHYALFGIHAGSFGVDIFFIISGFIIAYVVNFTTKDFLIKRIIRIVPLYIIATSCTIFLTILKPQWFKSVILSIEAVLKSFLFIPYRLEQSGPILSLGWTLNFEMFFYLAMTVCILFIKNKKKLVVACSLLLTVFLIIIYVYPVDYYPLNFYRKGLLPEFIYGLFLYYFWEYIKNIKAKDKIRILYFTIGVCALIFLIYSDLTKEFNYISRNIRTGIPCLLIVAGFMSVEPFLNGKSKTVKLLSLIGDSSYAMYLFHPFILFGFTRVVFPYVFGAETNTFLEVFKFIIASSTLIVVSVLIYKFLDKPLNAYLRKIIVKK